MIQLVREIAQRIFSLAKATPVQVLIRVKKGVLVRFTNNGVHQNGFQALFSYTLRLGTKKGPIWVESNDPSEEGILSALSRAQAAVSDWEPLSVLGRLAYPKVHEHFPLRVEKTPERAARAIEEAVRLIRREQASANGYYSAYERFFYFRDSRGLEVFHPTTAVRFGVTVTKGAGKGYFSFYHPNPAKLRVPPIVKEAIQLAEQASRAEIKVEPGEYECIFSPRAFLELIEPLRRHFDRQLYQDQKSVLSGLLGKPIFSKALTLMDDLGHPGQFGVPFDMEGSPKRKVVLVERGLLKGLLAQGHSTRGLMEHPFYPQNLVVEKGRLSLAGLFRRIRRGIFINKIWYHTLVRESEMEVTGLATAGSVFLEEGRVRGRVVHLRYHDSLFSILGSVVGTSKEQILLKDGEWGASLFPYLWVSRLRVV